MDYDGGGGGGGGKSFPDIVPFDLRLMTINKLSKAAAKAATANGNNVESCCAVCSDL
jgi:hypothetical protein